jgi:hypothetical protein
VAANPKITAKLVAAALLTTICVASCFFIGRGCDSVMRHVDKSMATAEKDLSAAAGKSELKAEVKYADGSFSILNRDSSDWLNVVFEVNGTLLRGGYDLRADRIAAGATSVIAATRFADSDGTRFDPITMKPQTFAIRATCDGEMRFVIVVLK